VAVKPGERGELFQIADVFGAAIKDVGIDSVILELTGDSSKIDDMVMLLDRSILELARSGLVSLERGRKTKEKNNRRTENGNNQDF
jgi:acetolactate synthase-1/3 small subunit